LTPRRPFSGVNFVASGHPAPLVWWELPTFKFGLEESAGKGIGNSYGKEATVAQLPISKGIAGVSMRLEAGALRTLHWHPNADEWQYVVEGEVSVTLFGSHGRYRIEQLQKETSATSRRATGIRSNQRQQACPHPDRVQRRHL